ncbi:unnamed protein product [Spodoptera exigua]|nr:unnamed protein product [Spodoptera exigua]
MLFRGHLGSQKRKCRPSKAISPWVYSYCDRVHRSLHII